MESKVIIYYLYLTYQKDALLVYKSIVISYNYLSHKNSHK